jgi:hypothetical protein
LAPIAAEDDGRRGCGDGSRDDGGVPAIGGGGRVRETGADEEGELGGGGGEREVVEVMGGRHWRGDS